MTAGGSRSRAIFETAGGLVRIAQRLRCRPRAAQPGPPCRRGSRLPADARASTPLDAAHNGLGRALAAMGRLKEAESAYRRAIALAPPNLDALDGLGNVLQELGCRARRKARIAKFFASSPTPPPPMRTSQNCSWRSPTSMNRFHRPPRSRAQPDFAYAHSNLIFTLDVMASTDVRVQQAGAARLVRRAWTRTRTTSSRTTTSRTRSKSCAWVTSRRIFQHSAYNVFGKNVIGGNAAAKIRRDRDPTAQLSLRVRDPRAAYNPGRVRAPHARRTSGALRLLDAHRPCSPSGQREGVGLECA